MPLWNIRHYKDWDKEDLYDCLALRTEVFVIEQDCPYQEVDGRDRKSWHVWARSAKGEVMAYARIVEPGVSYRQLSIGRVVVSDKHRGKQLGRELMVECLRFVKEELDNQPIHISAQEYLTDFYESLGFQKVGEGYLEDGIPHVGMDYSEV